MDWGVLPQRNGRPLFPPPRGRSPQSSAANAESVMRTRLTVLAVVAVVVVVTVRVLWGSPPSEPHTPASEPPHAVLHGITDRYPSPPRPRVAAPPGEAQPPRAPLDPVSSKAVVPPPPPAVAAPPHAVPPPPPAVAAPPHAVPPPPPAVAAPPPVSAAVPSPVIVAPVSLEPWPPLRQDTPVSSFAPLFSPVTLGGTSDSWVVSPAVLSLQDAAGVALLFHGCSHTAEVWATDGGGSRALVDALLRERLLPVALTSSNARDARAAWERARRRGEDGGGGGSVGTAPSYTYGSSFSGDGPYHRCWVEEDDVPYVLAVVAELEQYWVAAHPPPTTASAAVNKSATPLPLVGVGASSGGSFVSLLPLSIPALKAVAIYISSLAPPVLPTLSTQRTLGRPTAFPPTTFIHMPLDGITANAIQEDVRALIAVAGDGGGSVAQGKAQGTVEEAARTLVALPHRVHPLSFSAHFIGAPTYLDGRASEALWEGLRDAGVLISSPPADASRVLAEFEGQGGEAEVGVVGGGVGTHCRHRRLLKAALGGDGSAERGGRTPSVALARGERSRVEGVAAGSVSGASGKQPLAKLLQQEAPAGAHGPPAAAPPAAAPAPLAAPIALVPEPFVPIEPTLPVAEVARCDEGDGVEDREGSGTGLWLGISARSEDVSDMLDAFLEDTRLVWKPLGPCLARKCAQGMECKCPTPPAPGSFVWQEEHARAVAAVPTDLAPAADVLAHAKRILRRGLSEVLTDAEGGHEMTAAHAVEVARGLAASLL